MRIGLLQFEKKQAVPLYKKILNPILFVILGLAFSSIFIAACGFQPIPVFAKMISYSFLNERGITSSINAALPLMFCGLSVAVAFKMNLSNIGAEGQFAMGALAGGAFALYGMFLLSRSVSRQLLDIVREQVLLISCFAADSPLKYQ